MPDRLKRLKWWQWTLVALAVLTVIGAASGGGDKTPRSSSAPGPASAPSAPAAAPTLAARPTPPRTLAGRLKQAVVDLNLRGEGKVKVETEASRGRPNVLIYHELADNVTQGLAQRGAELDAQKIMQAVYTGRDRLRVRDTTVLATSKLIDKLGNESTGVAFSVSLPGAIARKVNWDNIASIDIRDVWEVNVDLIK